MIQLVDSSISVNAFGCNPRTMLPAASTSNPTQETLSERQGYISCSIPAESRMVVRRQQI